VAKTKTAKRNTELPMCQAFVLAEHAASENNILTIIRIIDQIEIGNGPPSTEGKLHLVPLNLVAIVKADKAVGSRSIAVDITGPENKTERMTSEEVVFDDAKPESGFNLIRPVVLTWQGFGLYWVALKINDIQIAKTTLRMKDSRPASSAKTTSDVVGVIEQKKAKK
jgi:hypothetical protein